METKRARGAAGWSRRGFLAAAAATAIARPSRVAAATRLRLGHGLPADHPVHVAMQAFADRVREQTGGEIDIQLYPNGIIGDEPNLLDQLKAGRLDLAKVSATAAERLVPAYRAFSLPFLFRDKGHWQAVLTGTIGQEALRLESYGLVGLTYYDAGARSFYGRKPIAHPDDLKGLRIRVQPSATAAQMIRLLGGEPVQLPWDVVYGALASRLVDGAENNITALTNGRHAEAAGFYSFTEHTIVPDLLLMSARSWGQLTGRQQEILRETGGLSFSEQSELWRQAETVARTDAERLGVVFNRPAKGPFMERVASMRAILVEDAATARLVTAIEQISAG